MAALTVGLLELRLGRHETARAHLAEASERGGRFGNRWLASVARTLRASLAMQTGHIDEARGLLAESVAGEDTAISIQTVTFCLIASAELALVEGDSRQAALAVGAANGLRKRAGLRAWPSRRRSEAELLARVAEKLGLEDFKKAIAAGSELSRRDAIALVRSVAKADNGPGRTPAA